MKENEEHNLTVVTAKASFNRKTKHVLITKLSVMKLARISSVVNTSRTSSPDLSRNSWRLVSHKGAKSATKLENEWKDKRRGLSHLPSPGIILPLCEKNSQLRTLSVFFLREFVPPLFNFDHPSIILDGLQVVMLISLTILFFYECRLAEYHKS